MSERRVEETAESFSPRARDCEYILRVHLASTSCEFTWLFTDSWHVISGTITTTLQLTMTKDLSKGLRQFQHKNSKIQMFLYKIH
jgi:hypothetical protein